MKGHEEYKQLLAFAALDAAGEEARSLEAHLSSCDECRAELRELRDASALVALASDPVTPPTELRARVLDAIKSTPRESPAGAGGATTSRVGATHDARPISDDGISAASLEGAKIIPAKGASVVSLEEARSGVARRRAAVSRSTFAFGALAASLLLCALAVASFVLWQRYTAMRSQVASLSTTLNRTQDELAARNAELERGRRERELLASPDARKADLAGAQRVAESARARLVFDARTGDAMLSVASLPPAPAGHAYQLWYIADGKPLPGPVFTTDAGGHGEANGVIPPEGRRAQVFAVTVEQSTGAQSPTGDIVLKGTPSS